MAARGSPDPAFETIVVGATRDAVEQQLGQPIASRVTEAGQREDTYRYLVGKAPSPRVAAYLIADYVSLGMAELILTPLELFKGHTEESVITYTDDDRVVAIGGYEFTARALNEAIKEQEKYSAVTKSAAPQPFSPQHKAAIERQEEFLQATARSRPKLAPQDPDETPSRLVPK